jgi:DNA invertase Pin-like site-specific DNA recombinase
MEVVIYARVSTNSQDYKRQVDELTEYAKQMKMNVAAVFEEKISGTKKTANRPIFSSMLSFVAANNVHTVLTWELSRMGRNVVEVLTAINELSEKGINLYIHNYRLNTLTPDGKKDIMSSFMVQILGSVAEMESTQIRQRLESGYIRHIKKGGRVGRSSGKESHESFLSKHKDVVKLLNAGQSVRYAAKISDKSAATVQKVRKLLNNKAPE